MLYLRGPRYLMGAELEEINSILADQEKMESNQTGLKSKIKELRSRSVLLPVLMMVLMFTLQVSISCFLRNKVRIP